MTPSAVTHSLSGLASTRYSKPEVQRCAEPPSAPHASSIMMRFSESPSRKRRTLLSPAFRPVRHGCGGPSAM